jgi:hypothetical protein
MFMRSKSERSTLHAPGASQQASSPGRSRLFVALSLGVVDGSIEDEDS